MFVQLNVEAECLKVNHSRQFALDFQLNVPVLFMKVAMDDGTGPSIKYQYPDLGKLHHVVSLLVRSMDVSSRCRSAINGSSPLPNKYCELRYADEGGSRKCPLIPMPEECIDFLYNRTGYET